MHGFGGGNGIQLNEVLFFERRSNISSRSHLLAATLSPPIRSTMAFFGVLGIGEDEGVLSGLILSPETISACSSPQPAL